MAVNTFEQLTDLVATTQKDLGEPNFTDLTSDLQRHLAMRVMMKRSQIKLSSGYAYQWDIMTNHNGSARMVPPGAVDVVNIRDVMTQATIGLKNLTANYSIIGQEIDMNAGERQIVDLVKNRRFQAQISVVELMETQIWRCPAASDELSINGIPYWIVKSASAAGFNGTVPSGYTTVAGVSPTTYPRWANYTAPYTTVDYADFFSAWWTAATLTDFVPPVDGMPLFNTGDSYGFYCNYALYKKIKQQLIAQNEDIGTDLDEYEGSPRFRKVPLTWCPKLDEDTTDPLYGINWGEMKTAVKTNWWNRETLIKNNPNQHTISTTHLDYTFNLICRNRRRNFVISNGTSMPS